MSDRAKPWLETWSVHGDMLSMSVRSSTASNVRLITAAPTLARALCRVEWNVWGDCDVLCPCCCAPRLRGHAADCPLDAALTAAGLSEKDREEVRRGV